MKRIVLFILLGMTLAVWLGMKPAMVPVDTAFTTGEHLKFKVHYGFINAGFVSLQVADEPVSVRGHSCYHIVGKGWTNKTWDVVFKIRDQYETYMDRKQMIPWHFKRHIVEGSFDHFSEVRFEHEHRQAIYIDPRKKETPYQVPADIQDVISAFYAARARYNHTTLAVGDRISLRNFLDRKTFNLQAELLERETLKIEGKRFNALHFKLLIEEAGLITDGSKIEFWISDDANKLPLRIQSDLVIGSLKADLIGWKGLRHDFNALVP